MENSYSPESQNNQTYITGLRIASERDAEVLDFLRSIGKIERQIIQTTQALDDSVEQPIIP